MEDGGAFVAQYYTKYLQDFLNKPREESDYQVLRERLPMFFGATLPLGDITVQLAQAQSYCAICKQAPTTQINLNCAKRHVACWNCLSLLIRNTYYYQKVPYNENVCPQCKTTIDASLCWQILSMECEREREEESDDSIPEEVPAVLEVRRSVSEINVPFDCVICYDKGMSADEVTLECKHMFHKGCLKDHFDSLVEERKVNENDITCLMCSKPISMRILQLVSPEKFEKFNEVASKQAVDFLAEENEAVSYCGKCGFVVYVPLGTKAVTCIKCKTYYCTKCSRKWHQGECLPDMDEG